MLTRVVFFKTVTATAESRIEPSSANEATYRSNVAPTFKPQRFAQFKAAKWEPTTDSEVSDHEAARRVRGTANSINQN